MTLKFIENTINPGIPAPVPNARKLITDALLRLEKSHRARLILGKLRMSDETFHILASGSVLPMFMHKEYLAALHIGVQGGIVAWLTTDFSKVRHGTGKQNADIKLIHELGHAYQWETKHNWYMQRVKPVIGAKLAGKTLDKTLIKLRNEVENDNIKMNETPVAQDLHQGWRDKYD
jgi:hypothetical protein